MQIIFSPADISEAPEGYTPVKIAQNTLKRVVVEGGREALEIGVGPWSEVTGRKFQMVCRSIIQTAKQNKLKKIAVQLNKSPFPKLKGVALPELASIIAQNFAMANYEPNTYKTTPKGGWNLVEEVMICGDTPKAMQAGFAKGLIIAGEVNACRELANTPGSDMTPESLADAAVKAAEGTPARVKILGKAEMAALGMGGVLGVAKGSIEEPQFIVVEYWGAERTKKPLVLIGKGVTFDTGGLQVKPGDSMYEMHMDMSGGAAVIHAVVAAAKLGLKKNVIALVPAVENASASHAFRPGDILKSMSGKTIEILHTDAEGRVILADAITYAKRYKPAAVIDVATLTGASLIAMGTVASAFMTNKEASIPALMEIAEQSGDLMWPLPLWEEYDPMVKGTFGDVPNISTMGNSRYGGVIAGGKFLEVFAKELECPWVHIDMAPRMTTTAEDNLSKGAAGNPVRFLIKAIETGVK